MQKQRTALAFFLLLFIVAVDLEAPVSAQIDCYDACSTACVNPDPRLMLRCDRKCQIRCGPDDARAKHVLGGNLKP